MKSVFYVMLFISQFLAGEISPFYEMGLRRLGEKASLAATEKEKLSVIERLNRWLLLMDKADFTPDELERIMNEAEAWLTQISSWTYEFQQKLRPIKKQQILEVEVKGRKTIAYLNAYTYRNQAPFSSEAIQQFLALEKRNYEKYKVYEGFSLCSTETLPSGNYNFIVTLDESTRVSIHQDFDSIHENGFKILISPNHAVLGEGKPVLTAGEMRIIGKGSGRIYIISNTSGHYQPDFASLREMEIQLITLGVPRSCIVKTAIPLEKLGWKLMRHYVP